MTINREQLMPSQPSGLGKWTRIVLHAAGAGAFVFVLQHYLLHQTLEVSSLWALGFAAAGAHLAWLQSSRQ